MTAEYALGSFSGPEPQVETTTEQIVRDLRRTFAACLDRGFEAFRTEAIPVDFLFALDTFFTQVTDAVLRERESAWMIRALENLFHEHRLDQAGKLDPLLEGCVNDLRTLILDPFEVTALAAEVRSGPGEDVPLSELDEAWHGRFPAQPRVGEDIARMADGGFDFAAQVEARDRERELEPKRVDGKEAPSTKRPLARPHVSSPPTWKPATRLRSGSES